MWKRLDPGKEEVAGTKLANRPSGTWLPVEDCGFEILKRAAAGLIDVVPNNLRVTRIFEMLLGRLLQRYDPESRWEAVRRALDVVQGTDPPDRERESVEEYLREALRYCNIHQVVLTQAEAERHFDDHP